jgi:hypothetical protein
MGSTAWTRVVVRAGCLRRCLGSRHHRVPRLDADLHKCRVVRRSGFLYSPAIRDRCRVPTPGACARAQSPPLHSRGAWQDHLFAERHTWRRHALRALLGRVADSHARADAAAPGRVGLGDVDQAAASSGRERRQPGPVRTAGQRRARQPLPYPRVALQVIRREIALQPFDPVRTRNISQPDGGLYVQ